MVCGSTLTKCRFKKIFSIIMPKENLDLVISLEQGLMLLLMLLRFYFKRNSSHMCTVLVSAYKGSC